MTITAKMVQEALGRQVEILRERCEETQAWAQARADTLREYKEAFSKALVEAEGKSAEQRKARALLLCMEEFGRYEEAETLWKTAIEAERSQRQVLSAFQSWSGVVRDEMTLTRTTDQ